MGRILALTAVLAATFAVLVAFGVAGGLSAPSPSCPKDYRLIDVQAGLEAVDVNRDQLVCEYVGLGSKTPHTKDPYVDDKSAGKA